MGSAKKSRATVCLPDFLSSFGLLQEIPVKFPLFLSGLDYENDHRINKADDEHPEKPHRETVIGFPRKGYHRRVFLSI